MFNRRRERQFSDELTVVVEGLGKRYFKKPAIGAAVDPDGRQSGDHFWALRNVSFELHRGDVVGIIGRNGSGKSTLLKILSGITTPTEGRAEIAGRVGSLLEIGTGFHPDLTGRDNIFLAGSLLGVPRQEIAERVEAIAAFAGIGIFLDVPVKRYSSGMYVRLAYAVSALLRSDILILDEVLSVGDAEFQERTRSHVENLANDGRTVLLVSHSMDSVKKFCNKCLWLEDGRVKEFGDVGDTTGHYLDSVAGAEAQIDFATAPAWRDLTNGQSFYPTREKPVIRSIRTTGAGGTPTRLFRTGDPLTVEIGYRADGIENLAAYFSIFFLWPNEERRMVLHSAHADAVFHLAGEGTVTCRIDELRLAPGVYSLMLDFGQIDFDRFHSLDCLIDATRIRIEEHGWAGYPLDADEESEFLQRSRWSGAA